MDMLIVITLSVALLALLSTVLGVDSRDAIEDTHRGHVTPKSI